MRRSPSKFNPREPERLHRARLARELMARFNGSVDPWSADATALLQRLLGFIDTGAWIEAPVFCEYGHNVRIGRDTFINTGCVFLDAAPITIGARVLLGPRVQLLTVGHPVDASERLRRDGHDAFHAPYRTYAAPIDIADDVWLGAGCIVLPGVTVGRGATVGAGAVVTQDVMPNVLVVGTPARVVRHLNPKELPPNGDIA